jgi:hypothetical protein
MRALSDQEEGRSSDETAVVNVMMTSVQKDKHSSVSRLNNQISQEGVSDYAVHETKRDILRIFFYICFTFEMVSVALYTSDWGADLSTVVTAIFLLALVYHYHTNQWCVMDGTDIARSFKRKHRISIVLTLIMLLTASVLSMDYNVPTEVLVAFVLARSSISLMVVITMAYQINTMSYVKLVMYRMKIHRPLLEQYDPDIASPTNKQLMVDNLIEHRSEIDLLRAKFRFDTIFNLVMVSAFVCISYMLLLASNALLRYLSFLLVSLGILVASSSLHCIMLNEIISGIESTLHVKTKMQVKVLIWTPNKGLFASFIVGLFYSLFRLVLQYQQQIQV